VTVELWIWIALAVAVVVVAAWPLLARRRVRRNWTADEARSRIAELETALDRPDHTPAARAKAERHLLLAGAAMSGSSRQAARRAGTWADRGLAQLQTRTMEP
jgi:hypothetical protein